MEKEWRPMKPVFTDLVGNDALRERLGEEIRSDRFGHAYILEGPAGTGKHALALRIAAALACEHRTEDGFPIPCCECPACRKILSGNSPDVIFVNRADKVTLGVDAIREMRTDVLIPPNDLDDKVYVIEDAQTMTVQAQNAFLLILEEPPAYVHFLLLTDGSAPLLETVRSRAQTLRVNPLSPEALSDLLVQTEPAARILKNGNPSEFGELIAASGGCVGRAKMLLDPKQRRVILDERESAREFAKLAADHRGSAAVLAFLNTFGSKREEAVARFSMMLVCVRDLILLKQTDSAPLCFFYDREEACSLAYRFTAPDLLRIADGIDEAMENLRRNANLRLTLTRFAMRTGLLQ